ncbi:uncharacterized protein LY79DRAFT_85028 [Colletotrichum navitas]|uniref:Uncharacterized protein n=1 Tax=Colletotrichum navitas TaxID=681940 RepID=A0AAD8PL23_9PEZI|nr:uncharacterized protein LY79DRAFT_85028 [Colletotrichum navitas]KAK1569526.1 hypothetical protein LY79DRAFT_85028 [Colletotrichum navitas]
MSVSVDAHWLGVKEALKPRPPLTLQLGLGTADHHKDCWSSSLPSLLLHDYPIGPLVSFPTRLPKVPESQSLKFPNTTTATILIFYQPCRACRSDLSLPFFGSFSVNRSAGDHPHNHRCCLGLASLTPLPFGRIIASTAISRHQTYPYNPVLRSRAQPLARLLSLILRRRQRRQRRRPSHG